MSLCRDMMPPWEMKAEMDRQATEIERLRAALREIADCKTFTDREYMIGIARKGLGWDYRQMEGKGDE